MLFYVSDESEFEFPFRAGSQQVVVITWDTRRYKTIQDAIFISMFLLKNPLPYSLEYVNDQRNRWGVSRKQFLSIFKRATYLTYPAREFFLRPQLPLQEVDENIPSGTSILLTRSILPNILLRTKNDKHKQRVFRSSEHNAHTAIPILERTTGIKDKSRLE